MVGTSIVTILNLVGISVSETLPPETLSSIYGSETMSCDVRSTIILYGGSFVIAKFDFVWDTYDQEWMVIDE